MPLQSSQHKLFCTPVAEGWELAGGNAWNQLAVLDALGGDVASSVANYCRSLACERPYEVSKVASFPAPGCLPSRLCTCQPSSHSNLSLGDECRAGHMTPAANS